MKLLEDFILAHPSLMHTNLFRYPAVVGFVALAFVTLGMAFRSGRLTKGEAWSSAEDKTLRLCLIVMACFCVFLAYEKWQFPEHKDFANPILAYSLCFLWIFLLGLGCFFAFRREKQGGWTAYKAAYPKLKTKRDFIIHFTGAIFVMPFLVIGVLASGLFVMWLTGAKMSDQTTIWEAILYMGLMPFGVLGGALIGNIAWMFILSRFASEQEMRTWSEYDTTSIPLFTPASKAIDEFFIRKKVRRQ